MADETTPLLATKAISPPSPNEVNSPTTSPFFNSFRRLLTVALILSISFVLTATTLLYSFNKFACDEFYENFEGGKFGFKRESGKDRCSRPEVEASAASAISIMVTATTISGVLNLMTTSHLIRTRGVKLAMVCQTLFPCFRNVCQTIAMYAGGRTGIRIVTYTQSITILGGGAGYLLCCNSMIAEIVSPEDRTAAFGILQGFTMLGTAIGFSLGGVINDLYGLAAPFEVTLGLLIFSTVLSAFFLPYIPPAGAPTDGSKTSRSGVWRIAAPLKVFIPSARKSKDGLRVVGKKQYGLTLLGIGSVFSILATAYIPLLLQLSGTNRFGFGPSENGYLMSTNSLLRALFLTIFFPRIISYGRKFYTPKNTSPPSTPPVQSLPTTIDSFEPLPVLLDAQEPIQPPPPTNRAHGAQFDLVFLQSSIFVDAILTSMCYFIDSGWQMYLAAAILPFASGTAAASKGVITDMLSKEQKSDGLAAIALLESLAMTVTVSLFGLIFAYLSGQGKGSLVFLINGGTALLATFILSFVRFAPDLDDFEEV